VSVPEPSYEELAALVVKMTAHLEQAGARITALEAEVAALRARLGRDSTNSSTPPSADSLAAKGKRKAARSQRVRSVDRKRGGQPGRRGSGLTPTQDPDRTERVAGLESCTGCGSGLSDAHGVGHTWGQVWDVLPVAWEKIHYVLPKRRCSCCGRLNTPAPPFGQTGAVVYGPRVNAAAILLGLQGNVPVEATAQLMEALLDAPVSTGFVARAQQRLADVLDGAGFDEAMKRSLRAEPVLGADESPVNIVSNVDADGQPAAGSPHLVTVRTPDQRLVWYAATTSRSSASLKDLGIFDQWPGVLVRDDYVGYHQFDATLGGVQQCVSHLLRHLAGVAELDADNKLWAEQVAAALRDAGKLVNQATTTGQAIHADKLADARWRYDHGVKVGISFNLSRPWPKGNHPGLVLARRLQDKADQVWLFTDDLRVPWTNNAAEQAIRGPKRHQKISGYWQSTHTLTRYCRLRSYLVSARNHGLAAIDAIHTALAGTPWLPTPATA
jgi:transposase